MRAQSTLCTLQPQQPECLLSRQILLIKLKNLFLPNTNKETHLQGHSEFLTHSQTEDHFKPGNQMPG